MSGMVKQEQIKVEDSNMALVGTDVDRKVKKGAAECEPAWKNAGKKDGVEVWRINKFQVEEVPKEEVGTFYKGDSYIILHSKEQKIDGEEKGKMDYDLFFWIGKNSSQDEYGTAAYKTVELDTWLDDAPVQYREICGNESEMFLSCFKNIQFEAGGYDTGFNKVTEKVIKTQLYKYRSTRNSAVRCWKAIEMDWNKINAHTVYVLVTNTGVYQYNGSQSRRIPRYHTKQWIQTLNIMRYRPSTPVHIIDDDDEAIELLSNTFETEPPADFDILKEPKKAGEASENVNENEGELILLRRDQSKNEWVLVAKGNDIQSVESLEDDLYLLDIDTEVVVWDKRDKRQKKEASMILAQEYLSCKEDKKKQRSPISCEKDERKFLDKCKQTKQTKK